MTKNEIQEILKTNDMALQRAVMVVYANQTEHEQLAEETTELNGVGFNGCDANFLTSIAKQIQNGWTLSEKQMACVRKAMPKYWKQLQVAAEQKAASKQPELNMEN